MHHIHNPPISRKFENQSFFLSNWENFTQLWQAAHLRRFAFYKLSTNYYPITHESHWNPFPPLNHLTYASHPINPSIASLKTDLFSFFFQVEVISCKWWTKRHQKPSPLDYKSNNWDLNQLVPKKCIKIGAAMAIANGWEMGNGATPLPCSLEKCGEWAPRTLCAWVWMDDIGSFHPFQGFYLLEFRLFLWCLNGWGFWRLM